MTDTPQTYAPPPPPTVPPQAPPVPGAAPVPPEKKKRTLLIVLIVAAVLLLGCCCGSAAVGWFVFRAADESVESGTDSDTAEPADDEPSAEDRARLDAWESAKADFPSDEFPNMTGPDDRQLRLAKAFLSENYPDFELVDMLVDPGSKDDDGYYTFDWYALHARLIDDPDVEMAVSAYVAQPEAESLPESEVEVEGDDELLTLEGRTWALHDDSDRGPLSGGIGDDRIPALLAQACEDWPGAVVTWVIPEDDGTVRVDMEPWEVFSTAKTANYAKAIYAEDVSGGWVLESYEIVTGESD